MAQIDQITALLEKWGPVVADAFLSSIAGIKSRIVLVRIIERLKAGDIDGAVKAINVEPAAFLTLETALRDTFISGGTTSASSFPRLPSGSKISVLFDVRNPEAEAWLRHNSAQLVTQVVAEQQTSIREALTYGMAAGQNPTQTALDIVGRISRATAKREGGILGLTPQQAQYVATAKGELSSGDAEQLKNYLKRGRRDKRFDRAVAKAIQTGKPMDADTVAQITGRYSDRLLKLRGDMIGRTETLGAINTSDDLAFRQGLAKTNYSAAQVTRVWRSAGDSRVRHTHQVLDGEKAAGLDTPFVSPSGARLRYPGDTSLGAAAAEVIGCRCRVQRKFDFFAGVR